MVIAGWSSQVARKAHNLEVSGSNPLPATILTVKKPQKKSFTKKSIFDTIRKNRVGTYVPLNVSHGRGDISFCL